MNEEKLASMVAEIARSFGWQVAFHTRNGEVVGVSVADERRMRDICYQDPDADVWGVREIDG